MKTTLIEAERLVGVSRKRLRAWIRAGLLNAEVEPTGNRFRFLVDPEEVRRVARERRDVMKRYTRRGPRRVEGRSIPPHLRAEFLRFVLAIAGGRLPRHGRAAS